MKKELKLVRNILIILLFLCASYFFSRKYTSLENCIQDTMKNMYAEDITTLIATDTYAVTFSEKTKKIYWLTINKEGIFYSIDSIQFNQMQVDEEYFDVHPVFLYDRNEILLIIYRVDENVDYIVVNYGDGSFPSVFGWENNLIGIIMKEKDVNPSLLQIYAYDKNNQLLDQQSMFEEE